MTHGSFGILQEYPSQVFLFESACMLPFTQKGGL